jgi:uncharacterized protein (UPF0276 family)
LIEWDTDIPSFEVLMAEADKADVQIKMIADNSSKKVI